MAQTAFMDKLLERKTSWASTGGDCKGLELENSIKMVLQEQLANNIWRRKR